MQGNRSSRQRSVVVGGARRFLLGSVDETLASSHLLKDSQPYQYRLHAGEVVPSIEHPVEAIARAAYQRQKVRELLFQSQKAASIAAADIFPAFRAEAD